MSIVEFLLARIAEDEAVARQSSNPMHGDFDVNLWEIQPHGLVCGWKLGEEIRDDCTCMWPARVLAECEAKRRIVEYCSDQLGDEYERGPVLELLAQPYAEHPEFQEKWRV